MTLLVPLSNPVHKSRRQIQVQVSHTMLTRCLELEQDLAQLVSRNSRQRFVSGVLDVSDRNMLSLVVVVVERIDHVDLITNQILKFMQLVGIEPVGVCCDLVVSPQLSGHA